MATPPVRANHLWETAFHAARDHARPTDVLVDVVFTDPDGRARRVPAFWAGEGTWRVRYSSAQVGEHTWRSECADDPGMDGVEGRLEVTPYDGEHVLYRRGGPRIANDQRHFEYGDGTPFFWLGDTWWMALGKRLGWPDEIRTLALDRVDKGFSVIQLVAGLFPDMPAFDPRGDSEAGWPWTEGWEALQPEWWDLADAKIEMLVDLGLVPCILGCWGYYLPLLGVERMKRHWREVIARWGAYPVVWCLAGEGAMPWYLTTDREGDRDRQVEGWTEVARYVRETDGFGRPITIHPTQRGSQQVSDRSVLDFDMLQTGHHDRLALPATLRIAGEAYAEQPPMPIIEGEVAYEGIAEACGPDVQRLMFWAAMLSGCCGYTYGANGIWQFNRPEEPFGPSPSGMAWGDTPWREAMAYPGARQLGVCRRWLEGFEWWRLRPMPEALDGHATPEQSDAPICAGIPGELRLVYLPAWGIWKKWSLLGLKPNQPVRARLFSLVDGQEFAITGESADEEGCWKPSRKATPYYRDWILAVEEGEAS